MSQNFNALVSGSTTFGTLYGILNNNMAAIISNFSGTSFPPNPTAWQFCVRTDLRRLYYYDGTSSSWEDLTDLFPDFTAVLAEVTAARGTAASLAARLGVALNPDGSLIAGAPAGGWWSTEGGTVARVSGTQFTVTGDKTAIYKKDRALFLDQTTDAYGYVAVDSTYSAGSDLTTVTVIGATVDTGITSVQYGQPVVSAPNALFASLFGANSVVAAITAGVPVSKTFPELLALLSSTLIANKKLFINAAGTAGELASGISRTSHTFDLSSSGAQTLIGAGFSSTVAIAFYGLSGVTCGIGISDGITHKTLIPFYGSSVLYGAINSHFIEVYADSGATKYQTTNITINSDGGALSWSKTGSPTGILNIEMIWLR